jgi:MerR family regulatory protein
MQFWRRFASRRHGYGRAQMIVRYYSLDNDRMLLVGFDTGTRSLLAKGRAMKLQDYLQIKAAAAFLGVSVNTLRNWERTGKLVAHRHPMNGYRLYLKSDLEAILAAIAKPEMKLPIKKDHE